MSANAGRAFENLYAFTLFGYPLEVGVELRVS
jgi:hypothetical protein